MKYASITKITQSTLSPVGNKLNKKFGGKKMRSIVTQEEDAIINYDHVVCIKLYAITAKIDGEDITAFELMATLDTPLVVQKDDEQGKDSLSEISLGVYFTEKQLHNVFVDLTKWLNEKADYHFLYTMPQAEYPVAQRLSERKAEIEVNSIESK